MLTFNLVVCRCIVLTFLQVIMVTGDHPITAKSIARMVGIISPGKTHNSVTLCLPSTPQVIFLTIPVIELKLTMYRLDVFLIQGMLHLMKLRKKAKSKHYMYML